MNVKIICQENTMANGRTVEDGGEYDGEWKDWKSEKGILVRETQEEITKSKMASYAKVSLIATMANYRTMAKWRRFATWKRLWR